MRVRDRVSRWGSMAQKEDYKIYNQRYSLYKETYEKISSIIDKGKLGVGGNPLHKCR